MDNKVLNKLLNYEITNYFWLYYPKLLLNTPEITFIIRKFSVDLSFVPLYIKDGRT